MFGILFGVFGLVFSVAFGLVSGTTKVAYGTTKVAVGTTTAVTGFTLRLALHNLVRAVTLALVGYFVYELIVGYTQGRSASAAPAQSSAPRPAPTPATSAASRPSPIVGGGDHAGRAIQVDDATGTHHTTRVGRGVIRR